MSRMHTSGFGTMGAAFLYFDALKRHAILIHLLWFSSRINATVVFFHSINEYQMERESCHPTAKSRAPEEKCEMKENEIRNGVDKSRMNGT